MQNVNKKFMFQRVYDSLPTSVFDRVGVQRELLYMHYVHTIILRLCLVVMTWILLFNFYICSNVYTFLPFPSLLCTFV